MLNSLPLGQYTVWKFRTPVPENTANFFSHHSKQLLKKREVKSFAKAEKKIFSMGGSKAKKIFW